MRCRGLDVGNCGDSIIAVSATRRRGNCALIVNQVSMKKILVMTLEQGTNYGGILQAYALQKVLVDLGHEPETSCSAGVLHRRLIKAIPASKWLYAKMTGNVRINNRAAATYTGKFVSEKMTTVTFAEAKRRVRAGHYDACVVGSDQVWRSAYAHVPHYLLSFVPPEVPRISYAASFGREGLDEYRSGLVVRSRTLARRFSAISVREDSGVQVVRSYWGLPAEHHVDPTMLLDVRHYAALVAADDSVPEGSAGELFSYILDANPDTRRIIEAVAARTGLTPFTVIDADGNNGRPMPSVTRWIKGFIDARFVVTDSFHGTVFAIIFNRPFIAVGNRERGVARFGSLLRTVGLGDRLVATIDDVTDGLIVGHIDWAAVNRTIADERESAREYLRRNLN